MIELIITNLTHDVFDAPAALSKKTPVYGSIVRSKSSVWNLGKAVLTFNGREKELFEYIAGQYDQPILYEKPLPFIVRCWLQLPYQSFNFIGYTPDKIMYDDHCRALRVFYTLSDAVHKELVNTAAIPDIKMENYRQILLLLPLYIFSLEYKKNYHFAQTEINLEDFL